MLENQVDEIERGMAYVGPIVRALRSIIKALEDNEAEISRVAANTGHPSVRQL